MRVSSIEREYKIEITMDSLQAHYYDLKDSNKYFYKLVSRNPFKTTTNNQNDAIETTKF